MKKESLEKECPKIFFRGGFLAFRAAYLYNRSECLFDTLKVSVLCVGKNWNTLFFVNEN